MIFVFIYILNAVWWVWVFCLVTQSCPTLCNPMNCSPPSSSVHGDFSRQEYWSGLPSPPQGVFPTQGLNPGLLHCRQIPYQLSYQGSPEFEWKWKLFSHVWLFATPWIIQSVKFSRPEYWKRVAFPFSRGSSQPRHWTQASHIAGRFFASWATREEFECLTLNQTPHQTCSPQPHPRFKGEDKVTF